MRLPCPALASHKKYSGSVYLGRAGEMMQFVFRAGFYQHRENTRLGQFRETV